MQLLELGERELVDRQKILMSDLISLCWINPAPEAGPASMQMKVAGGALEGVPVNTRRMCEE